MVCVPGVMCAAARMLVFANQQVINVCRSTGAKLQEHLPEFFRRLRDDVPERCYVFVLFLFCGIL